MRTESGRERLTDPARKVAKASKQMYGTETEGWRISTHGVCKYIRIVSQNGIALTLVSPVDRKNIYRARFQETCELLSIVRSSRKR